MAKIQAELSMLEAAETLIKRKIKPQKFSKIAKEVFELMGLTDIQDLDARTAQLYTDLSLSGKFVVLGDDMWDLKSRQTFETADYDTYELGFESEEPTPLLGDDAPVGLAPISALLGDEDDEDDEDVEKGEGAEDIDEVEEVAVSDDYGDDSNAEVKENEVEHVGLSVYNEDELDT
jgi:DNA-directed RNA polymerase subunit delta